MLGDKENTHNEIEDFVLSIATSTFSDHITVTEWPLYVQMYVREK